MKAFPSVMPASGCDKNKPGQLVDSNPSTVEVSGPYTRPFVREGSGRKAGKGINLLMECAILGKQLPRG